MLIKRCHQYKCLLVNKKTTYFHIYIWIVLFTNDIFMLFTFMTLFTVFCIWTEWNKVIMCYFCVWFLAITMFYFDKSDLIRMKIKNYTKLKGIKTFPITMKLLQFFAQKRKLSPNTKDQISLNLIRYCKIWFKCFTDTTN